MECPDCHAVLLTGAQFCARCGAPVALINHLQAHWPTDQTHKGVGSATDLVKTATRSSIVSDRPAEQLQPLSMSHVYVCSPLYLIALAEHYVFMVWEQIRTAMLLISLALLWLTSTFWPGVLVLLGVFGLLDYTAEANPRSGLGSFVLFVGLAVLFLTNIFWPGILVVLPITILLSPEPLYDFHHWYFW